MIALAPNALFVGRQPLLHRLEAMYRKGKLILLVGPSGAGKTMLVAKLSKTCPIFYAPSCRCLGDFLDALEPQAKLERGDLNLAPRVHRLVASLPKFGRTLVIDNVVRVPPKVAHLVRALMGTMPVWLIGRSSLPQEYGHVWPYLFAFKRIDLKPFSFNETRAFLAAAPFAGDREELLAASLRLHRLSAGHPAMLAAIVDELHRRTYDIKTMEGLHVLALHARITRVEAQLANA